MLYAALHSSPDQCAPIATASAAGRAVRRALPSAMQQIGEDEMQELAEPVANAVLDVSDARQFLGSNPNQTIEVQRLF